MRVRGAVGAMPAVEEQRRVCEVHTVAQVEKAPTVVKTGLKKEEAEELQKKLEAGKPLQVAIRCSLCGVSYPGVLHRSRNIEVLNVGALLRHFTGVQSGVKQTQILLW